MNRYRSPAFLVAVMLFASLTVFLIAVKRVRAESHDPGLMPEVVVTARSPRPVLDEVVVLADRVAERDSELSAGTACVSSREHLPGLPGEDVR